MRKRIFVSVIALVLILTVCASAFAETKWIKTGNGKPANGRREPSKDSELIGYAFYGEQVQTDGQPVNGYTYLLDGYWVLSSFLVNYDPGEFVPSTKPNTNSDSSGKSGKTDSSGSNNAGLQSAIVTEFKAARFVTPYAVTTYHKRSSGLINMRWAPSKKSALIHAYSSGEPLMVLAELKDWYQVQDPDTGWVGFVRSDFLQR